MVVVSPIIIGLAVRFSTVVKALRNVGIIAHIDAGKTTTTERILYNAGKIKFAGDVDKGTTVTDYLDQERERGISITSATASLKWLDHNINIIDTPGHVDFTLEVERALTVLDGSITIIDATKGVEAQTQTVWNQSKNHKIPNIFYINKFDRKHSNLNMCLKSIRNKMPNIVPLLIHLPYYSVDRGEFCGLVDVVDLKLYQWSISDKTDNDAQMQSRKISDSEPLFQSCLETRLQLLEALADLEDGVIRHEFLLLDNPAILIPNKMIHDALRHVTISAIASPVLIGSSRMNMGVNHLLDKIVEYLPNPTEKQVPPQFSTLASNPDHVSALAFKVIHDVHRGPLTFLRLYSGLLKPNALLKNLTRSVTEKVDKIIQMTGDRFTELNMCSSGNIVAVSGLKNCYTGDVLVDVSMSCVLNNDDEEPYSGLIPIPSPVIFASIEPYSISEIRALEDALLELSKEDPSLSFHRDEDTNQLIVGGMGNLHLEIILDRIKRDYKLHRTKLGKLKIVYKECPSDDFEASVSHDHILSSKLQGKDITISMSLMASPGLSYNDESQIEFLNSKEFSWGIYPPKIVKLIKSSMDKAVHSGGSLLRGQLMGTIIVVNSFIVESDHVSILTKSCHPLIRSAVFDGVRALIKKIDSDLLEPMMNVEVTFPQSDIECQYYVSKVQNDLNRRRSQSMCVDSSSGGHYIDTVKAFVPLAETMDYSHTVRTLTSGHASIHISFSHYGRMSKEAQEIITSRKVYRY